MIRLSIDCPYCTMGGLSWGTYKKWGKTYGCISCDGCHQSVEKEFLEAHGHDLSMIGDEPEEIVYPGNGEKWLVAAVIAIILSIIFFS